MNIEDIKAARREWDAMQEQREKQRGINGLMNVMSLMNTLPDSNPEANAFDMFRPLTYGNQSAYGGHKYDGVSEPTGLMSKASDRKHYELVPTGMFDSLVFKDNNPEKAFLGDEQLLPKDMGDYWAYSNGEHIWTVPKSKFEDEQDLNAYQRLERDLAKTTVKDLDRWLANALTLGTISQSEQGINTLKNANSVGDYVSGALDTLGPAMFLSGPFGNAYRGVFGAYHLANEEGLPKTYREFMSGNYGNAAKSLAGDAFNALIATHGIKGSYNDALWGMNDYGTNAMRSFARPRIVADAISGDVRSTRLGIGEPSEGNFGNYALTTQRPPTISWENAISSNNNRVSSSLLQRGSYDRMPAEEWAVQGADEAGFHIAKTTEQEMTPEQLDAFEVIHRALARSGREPIMNNSITHFAIKTNDGWALSKQEFGVVAPEVSKVNGQSVKNNGGVREYEVVNSGENYYLIKNNKDTSFDVISVDNIENYGPGSTEENIFSSLREQAISNGGRRNNNLESTIPKYSENKRLVEGYGSSDNNVIFQLNKGASTQERASLNGSHNRFGNPASRKVQIVDEVSQAIKDSKGNVMGFNVDGNIHLFPQGFNPETPIHEYSEVWGNAMMQNNPQGWKSVKGILQTEKADIWKEVLGDENYARIAGNEDALALEVLGRFSGKQGAARMTEMAKTSKGRELLNRVQRALEQFWKWVGQDLFKIKGFKSADEIADRVLYDMVKGTNLGKVKSDHPGLQWFNQKELGEAMDDFRLASTDLTPSKMSELPMEAREVRRFDPSELVIPESYKGTELIDYSDDWWEPSRQAQYIFDNYAKAMGRRRDYLYYGLPERLDGGFTAFKSPGSNSFLIGQQINPDGVFHPSHFSPESLRSGYELIQQSADAQTPILFTVTDDLTPMLEKFGYEKIGTVPQIFNGEIVTKDVVINKATTKEHLLEELDNLGGNEAYSSYLREMIEKMPEYRRSMESVISPYLAPSTKMRDYSWKHQKGKKHSQGGFFNIFKSLTL